MSPRLDKLARCLDGDLPDDRLWERLATGVVFGAMFAIFTPVLLFVWAVSGREVTGRGDIVVRVDLLAALYPLGAIVSGALLFGLVALARTRLLRALLGAVALLPFIAGIIVCMQRGHLAWRPLHTVTTILMALGFGAPIGWRMTPVPRRTREWRSRRSAV